MSSSVNQGLQSCLEPCVAEPRVLRLKLTSPNSNFSKSSEENTAITAAAAANNDNDKNGSDECNVKSQNGGGNNSGGWSFLQALTNTNSQTAKEQETEKNDKAYVHPLVKRTSSKLSEKSLEMCTESLGSETGITVSGESSDKEIDLLSAESGDCQTRQALKLQKLSAASKKLSHCRSFPPPLISISGSRGVQVKPHREGGRLVLKATAVPSPQSLFHAERGDGRLTLRLVKDFGPENDGGEVQDEGVLEAEEDEEVDQEEEEEEEEEEGVQIDDDDDEEEEEKEEEKEEELEGNNGNVGGEMGMGNLPRPSRCMESGRGRETGIRNWERWLLKKLSVSKIHCY